MKSFFSTAVVAVTTLTSTALAAGCPAADAPVCQTSGGSPNINDCRTWGDTPDNYAGGCAQPYGSGCHTDGSIGTCGLAFCQDDSASPVCLPEDQTHCIGIWVNQLIDQCGSNGKVGGYVHVPDVGGNYLNVELVHS